MSQVDTNWEEGSVFPTGAHFGVIQLPIDLLPKPSAQRIIQWVNRDGKLEVYISENAFIRAELLEHLHKMIRHGYQESVQKGGGTLHPIKTRLHWCRFTESFCQSGQGARINPETGLPEEDQNASAGQNGLEPQRDAARSQNQ